ncbi:MAG: hypothetical protein V7636_1859 [Actinomycetota bacterium]
MVTVDESTGPDTDEAVLSALYANVESLAHEATRANELAQSLRTAIDDARRQLDGLRTEHEAQQRSIEEDLVRARADADASVASIREQLDGAQRELEEVRGSHLVLESEVLRLEQTRNEVRDELADLQSRLFGMLPAIDRVQSAQRELAAALEPEPEDVGDGEAQVEEEALPSRPIGRLMDALDEDGG